MARFPVASCAGSKNKYPPLDRVAGIYPRGTAGGEYFIYADQAISCLVPQLPQAVGSWSYPEGP
jgi:hypothetical protein